MVTPAATDIFYPESDGMPLPDALYQLDHFVEILSILKLFFSPREDVAVSGDNFIYYQEGNPRANVAPDCFVLIGGNVDSLWANNTYLVWEVGKAPDFVLEIGYPSAWRQDMGPKRELYASLEEKTAAVDECLSKLESDPERVKSLVSWEWIMRNVQGLSEDYAASSG